MPSPEPTWAKSDYSERSIVTRSIRKNGHEVDRVAEGEHSKPIGCGWGSYLKAPRKVVGIMELSSSMTWLGDRHSLMAALVDYERLARRIVETRKTGMGPIPG